MKYYLLLAASLLFSCGTPGGASHDTSSHANETAEEHAAHGHEGEEAHNHEGEEAHDHQSETKSEAAHNHATGITLSVEQATALGLQYTKVEPQEFTGAIRTSGIIEPSTADNWSIVATSSGIVTMTQNGLNVGSAISKGAKIFNISSDKLAGDNLSTKVKIAKSDLDKAQAAFDRTEKLYHDNLVTATAMDEAKSALANARDTYANLSQSTSATAPAGGYITSLDVRSGDYVSQGQTLATVSSGKQLVLRADLTARYFDKLSQITSANFITPYNGSSYSIAELGGRLLSKGQVTDAGTYSVPIRFSIDNRASLIPGSSVEVFLTTTPMKDVLAIPVSSLTEEQGVFYVYLKTCTDSYAKQTVTPGQSNGLQVQILKGLHTGDVVVSNGAYFVRLAGMSSAIPHGHSH